MMIQSSWNLAAMNFLDFKTQSLRIKRFAVSPVLNIIEEHNEMLQTRQRGEKNFVEFENVLCGNAKNLEENGNVAMEIIFSNPQELTYDCVATVPYLRGGDQEHTVLPKESIR